MLWRPQSHFSPNMLVSLILEEFKMGSEISLIWQNLFSKEVSSIKKETSDGRLDNHSAAKWWSKYKFQWVSWVISQFWTAIITGKAKLNKYFNVYYGHQVYGSHFTACSELNLALRNIVCRFKNDTEEIKIREGIVQSTISMRKTVEVSKISKYILTDTKIYYVQFFKYILSNIKCFIDR